MFGDRCEIRLLLEAATPLHVGSGELDNMPARPGANETGSYAAIVRDHEDRPYLPATSIKGALRRLAEQHFPGHNGLASLFGQLRGGEQSEAPGVMGRLLVRGGRAVGEVPDAPQAPFANAVGKGAFIAARTKVEGKTGVADDHKLFHQEMAVPGLCFEIVMTLVRFGPDMVQGDALDLLKRLIKIVARDGLMLGRSQADGQGLLKVKGQVTITPYALKEDGELAPGEPEIVEAETASAQKMRGEIGRHSFSFLCAAPFAIIDSSVKGAGKDIAKEQGTVQLAAQRLAEKQPLILGSSISGALCARAHWLWRLKVLRGEMKDAAKHEDGPVNELFGTAGRRALIEIRNLSVKEAKGEKITSLKVDRFTGAPVHGALFTTDSFTGVRLSFDLVLSERGRAMSAEARALWEVLLADIDKHGLELGHGVNKGFGWFQRESTSWA
jgi:CRISPR/Cas system CSM-associated protein Csm3 (group 7 of RAMP superfamily)